MLPLTESGYKQMPYETISKEEYEKRIAVLKPIKTWKTAEKGAGTVYCDGDSCQIISEADFIKELEKKINKRIPLVKDFDEVMLGFITQNGIIEKIKIVNVDNLNTIPDSIGDLEHLKYLDLNNCGLKNISESIIELKNLTYINIQGNPELQLSSKIQNWLDQLIKDGKTVIRS